MPAAAKIKAHELRAKNKADLQGQVCWTFIKLPYCFEHEEGLRSSCHLQLKDLKQELGALRVAKVTGGAPNKLSKM